MDSPSREPDPEQMVASETVWERAKSHAVLEKCPTCGTTCDTQQGIATHHTMVHGTSLSPHYLMWPKVDIGARHECWEWQGAQSEFGHGNIAIQGTTHRAHQVAYFLFRGDIGDNHVLHLCDVPSCVNPAHLYLGNHSDNMLDSYHRGNHPKGEDHPVATLSDDAVRRIRERYADGESLAEIAETVEPLAQTLHPIIAGDLRIDAGGPIVDAETRQQRMYHSPLTPSDVREIRRRYASEDVTYVELGNEYSVDKTTIGNVVKRNTWSHIKESDND